MESNNMQGKFWLAGVAGAALMVSGAGAQTTTTTTVKHRHHHKVVVKTKTVTTDTSMSGGAPSAAPAAAPMPPPPAADAGPSLEERVKRLAEQVRAHHEKEQGENQRVNQPH